ncbi:NTF2 fold immunity protein [Acidovorax sp. NPDC077693]|uniref:NTF2 fold immunity protein n=1 Tax=unclassified Acidovorax TaxID=2684926 RepID=UPI0037C8F429
MHSFNPKEGFLPDEETAIAVAEIILIKIYGINQIKKQRPLSANLKGDIWDIKGSLSPQEVGGTAHIRIKKNGEIIQLSHSR